MRQSRKRARTLGWAGIALGAALLVSPPVAARDELTLRVNDAYAAPSGLAAIVLRTYASKPISQGQVCFRARSGGARTASPFTGIEGVTVFAKRRDGRADASLEIDGASQTIVVQFSSESGTINRRDGPLAVIYFRVSPDLAPGQRFDIEIDLANTALVDDRGRPVRLEPRGGELRIRRPSDPYLAEAEGDRIAPGRRAELGVETYEPVAMSSGQIGFVYDPAIASGKPRVKMSRKHGRRRFQADLSTPGLVLVEFRSRDGSWNRVPGEILSIRLPTSRGVRPGTRSPLAIDPSLTFFVAPDGRLLPFELENGSLRFTRDDD
ncbi:MAG: hypothetical protein R3325_08810 [Thermoanaerobaculia bacterium]|nr:hypothetical protein [Thermoanaerobaculia bacterium]